MYRHACWLNSLENWASVDLRRAALHWVEVAEGSSNAANPLEAALFKLHRPGPLGAWVLLGKHPNPLQLTWSFGSQYSHLAGGALAFIAHVQVTVLQLIQWVSMKPWEKKRTSGKICPSYTSKTVIWRIYLAAVSCSLAEPLETLKISNESLCGSSEHQSNLQACLKIADSENRNRWIILLSLATPPRELRQ